MGQGTCVIAAVLLPAVALIMLLPFVVQNEDVALLQTVDTDPWGVGDPNKFDQGFYERVRELAMRQAPTGDWRDGAYHYVVIIVTKYDENGRDVSGKSRDAVVEVLRRAGARDIRAAEPLSFVTASVPVGSILGISEHGGVYRMGDGESQVTPVIDAARVTVRATDDDLRGPGGVVANGSGVVVGVVDNGVNHPNGINDRVVDRVVCDSVTCRPQLAENVLGPDAANVRITHGTQVALIIAGSGFSENNGIAPGVDILDAGNGQRGGGGHTISMYTGFSWLLRSGADVANLSMSGGTCDNNDTTDTDSLIVGEAVDNGLVVVVGAGNDGAGGTDQQQVPAYNSVSGLACPHNVITVGGIDNRDRGNTTMYYDSSRGPGIHQINGTSYPVLKPEIVAPAYYRLPVFTTSGTTGIVHGTSYSAPAVTATAALVLQARDVEPATVKAAILLGANWTGPVPCTSVQYEMDNATDSCSHERQPSDFAEANYDGSLEIINNVGFGILDTAKTLDYVSRESGRHIVEANLDSDADTDVHRFEITDTANPVKVILSWTADPFFEDYYAPRGENYFADLGFTVDCPGMDTISAQSAYQSNEFAVFMPAETGTCAVTVTGSDVDTPRRSEQRYALASTFPLIPPGIQGSEPTISTDGRSPTNAQNVTFTVDFGKAVDPVTFDSSDISVSSGNASEPFTADNQIFTFTVGNPDDGALTASIPARAVLYADDNTNPASGAASVEIDTVSPKVVSIERTDPSGQITGSDTLTFGVAFNEPVTGVDLESFALSLDAIGYHGQFTHTRTVSMPMPDTGAAISDIITVTDPGRIASVSVGVDITHTFIGDLVVDLIAPDGTIMNLHNQTGSYRDDIDRTYTPDFDGTVVAGDWVLHVSDEYGYATGTLNGWTLTIVYSDVIEAVTGLNGTGALYPVTVSAILNGTYNLDIVQNNGITDIAGNLLNGTIPTGEDQSYIVNTSFILNTSSNNPPLVDAGPDLTVHEGQTVTLSGTAVDVEGDPLTYLWSHDSTALAIGLANDVLPSTTFTAPWVDSNSVATFTLTADDGTGTASDSTNVKIVDTSHPSRDQYDIGRISLGNTIPGTVQVSWEASEKTPINYRISWAKVGESYLTWTDSAGNAFPTVPSQTITGLEEGAEYRVKVRAIYDGNSGDWSNEVTITVTRTASIPATGSPSIAGTVQVGQTLTAGTSGITDADGMTNSTFSYQWVSNDGTADVDIAGAIASSHVLAAGDQGRTIKVRVAFTDDAGHAESLTSAATQAVAPAHTAPGAPTSLSVLPNGSGTLAASWQAPASNGGRNITGYTVQWKESTGSWDTPSDVTEATSTGTSHIIAELTDGTPHTVRVLATNDLGDGEPTSEETATPRGPRDIDVITLNGTTPGTVQASWDAPDEEPANYRISWTKVGEPYLTWTDSTGNAFPTYPFQVITGLEAGAEYKVRVRASYDGTPGDWSGEATVTVAGSPNNLPVVDAGSPRTALEGSLVRLSGTAVDPDGDHLTYMWSHDTAAPTAWFSNLTSPSTTFMAPRVSSNSTVTLTLTASDGTRTASDSLNVAVVATPEPPRGPYDIGRVTVSSAIPGTIQASWEEPDREPANYRVSWARVGQPYPTWTDLTGNAFPTYPFQAITGLEAGAEYKVRVRANYDGTAGDWSGVTITAAGTAANTPAAGSPAISGTAQVGQTLTANISGITDADGMTNSTLSYQWVSNDGATDADIAGATTSSHVLAAGDQGRTIKVRVAFTDDAGHAESLTSAATQAVAPVHTVPGSPQNLAVSTNGSGTLAVSWQAPASDGGRNITGYTVQWKESTGSWDTPSDVTEATSTGTSHTITGLTDGTPYTVRVLATNDIGNGEPTSEETVTPQAPALGPRDIGVITLNGTTPRTIQASWEAPREEPANYLISWAKVGEPYLTWTDSTGNAFPTVPFHIITDLEGGVQYKMKVRAIYDGNSGDWSAEVTVTVAGTAANTPAAGSPAISGTVQVGQTLTANISGITDADGMTNSTLSYQWVSNDGATDTDIAGATTSSHVLAAGDRGRTIKVRVAFTDDAGHAESLTSAATQAVASAHTVPGSPQNLAVSTNGSGTLAVSWQAPASDGGRNITGYTVQWKAASGSWDLSSDVSEATTTGTTHTITGLTDGTPYVMRALATNGIGDGEPTPEETATPQAPALGPRDIGVITLNGTTPGTIQVSWDAPDEEPANYRISWTKAGEPYLTWTDSTGNAFPTVPSQTITGLEEGVQYKLKVRASYDGTAGDWSGEVTVTVARSIANTPATGSPSIAGTVQVGQTLAADASGIADADGMTNSTLRYQWVSNDDTTDMDIAGATASRHVLTAGDQGRTIKVRVVFTDDAGHAESLTSAATQAVAPAFTVPGAPTSLSVLPNGSGTLAVSWQATASDGGRNITGYTVQWKAASGSWDSSSDVSEATTTGTTHTITGLTNGTPYAVRVLATNGIGDGEPTSEETATPQAPAPPRGPRDIGRVTLSSTTPGVIEALWEGPDEEPANYRIMWAKVGEPYLTWTDSTGNAFPTVPSHTIIGLEGGVEYKLKVRASYDGTAGDWSAEVTVATSTTNTATIPGAPQNLSVSTNSSGTLVVSWQAPASNGGSNLTGYTVQWKESTGSWDSSSDVSEVTTTGTAHTITGLTDGTPYAVRVLATNDVGDGEPTSEETATPQAPALGPRDIGVITLSSTTPGTTQVSWETPDEEPANYRVMWAKVGEPYLTWTDSTGNAFPIVPSHTITGLEEGVQYKLKVRASYDGTAGDWSGEVTVTVARTG